LLTGVTEISPYLVIIINDAVEMEHCSDIVMTPSKQGTTTSIRIEKVRKANVDKSQVSHVAGGQHQGLVINKQSAAGKLL